jgi:ferredoxin-NADP reductase
MQIQAACVGAIRRRKQMNSEPTTCLVKLTNRFPVAERTIAFQFEKPANFTFKPGQWIDITLLNPAETDAEGNVRGFSIASAPYEATLMVATRIRDTAFKRVLAKAPLNTEVKIAGPGGNLTLQNNPARTAVFLAGGIGVTPIRSILFNAAKQRLPHRIFFFFSNRRPEDAPFLADLLALQKDNSNYTVIATMTEVAKSHLEWSGETGFINKEMLAKYLGAAKSPIYYIVGPPKMVSALHSMLNESGVDDDDIRTEDFSGY